jgi:hypothetical protein
VCVEAWCEAHVEESMLMLQRGGLSVLGPPHFLVRYS